MVGEATAEVVAETHGEVDTEIWSQNNDETQRIRELLLRVFMIPQNGNILERFDTLSLQLCFHISENTL